MSAWCRFKIERMSGFDGHAIAQEDVPAELRGQQARSGSEGLQLFPDGSPHQTGIGSFLE